MARVALAATSLALVLAGAPALAAGRAAPATTAGQWTTVGGNGSRTALQGSSPSLDALRVRWQARDLDGAIYGAPLIDDGLVFVATESDVVYALSASSGSVVWRRVLAAPVPAGDLPCGDLSPTVGVTSTMVLDGARDELFVSAEALRAGTVHHLLFGLAAATGKLRLERDLDQPGWVAADQLQRTGLALSSGTVYLGFGGNYGDCGNYRGWVVGVPAAGGAIRAWHVPTTNQGAIWAPSGIAVDAAGDLYVATGNSASASRFDGGDAVYELSPDLRELADFAPRDFALDNVDDLDLGSTAPVLLRGGRAFIVGKEETAYLLDAGHLGGVGGELAQIEVCDARGGVAVDGALVFVACPDATMTAVRVGSRSLSIAWRAPAGVSGTPVVADGLVWSVADGVLYGLSPTSGSPVVERPVIPTEHFAAPSPGEGLLVVAGDGAVEAFEGARGYLGPS